MKLRGPAIKIRVSKENVGICLHALEYQAHCSIERGPPDPFRHGEEEWIIESPSFPQAYHGKEACPLWERAPNNGPPILKGWGVMGL